MNALFVTDALERLNPSVDASVGLMLATQAVETAVWVCGPADLSVVDGRVRAAARRLHLRPVERGEAHRWSVEPQWFHSIENRVLDVVGEVEMVQIRIDPPVDARYLHATYLLDLVVAGGVRVVNRPEGIRAFHEKLAALRYPELCPSTLVSTDPAEIRGFVAEHGAAVVKPVDGFAGIDVWLVHDDHSATAMLESATQGGARHVIAQEYLTEVHAGNKRLFVLDGEIVGAVTRRPGVDDFRIGPPVALAEIDQMDWRIVHAIAPDLASHGLVLAGVDVIAGRLIEVNVTCPGGMHKTDALLGTDLSGIIMRRLLQPLLLNERQHS